MARLKELNVYERFIMSKLCSNQRIVDVLLNTDKFAVTDFVNYPVPNSDVKFRNIFPYAYVPDIAQDASVFVCYTVYASYVYNKTFKEISVAFHVFAEQSLIVLDETTRINAITEEIDEMFNQKLDIGLGRLDLYSVDQLYNLPNGYHGKTIRYVNSEWNAPKRWQT